MDGQEAAENGAGVTLKAPGIGRVSERKPSRFSRRFFYANVIRFLNAYNVIVSGNGPLLAAAL